MVNTMTAGMDMSMHFGLLASMYLCKPVKEAIDGWKSLLADDASPELDGLRKALNVIDTAAEQTMEDLLWEYTRLFIGPYKLPCPPWESVYTSPKKLMMQDAADDVKRAYADSGLTIDDRNVMPDHIGAELNFLALVLRRTAEHPDRRTHGADAAARFVNEHLRKWIPAFTRDLEEASELALYKTLARTTGELLDVLGEDTPRGEKRFMSSIAEAQRAILEYITPLEMEKVPVFEGLNRITPEDHAAPWDIPAADTSAMDGFAFSHAALGGDCLRVTGFLPAGEVRTAPVPPGEAIRIMTGAPVPPGCDTVVPIEDVEVRGEWIRFTSPVAAGSHVREKGENIRKGEIAIRAGALLRPQEIGMLTAMGMTVPAVYRRARVAILATGDELLEPGSAPAPGKIINSNSASLAAQVLDAGGVPVLLGIAPDILDAICDKIKAGLNADLLVITGGVSVGDRDFVKEAIEKLGGSVAFWRVNVKPGKPLAFAMVQGKPIFALPGNPVSAMVSFELFIRPSILKAMGHKQLFRPVVKAVLQEPAASEGKRPHLVRGIVSVRDDRYHVSTTGNQSSGRLSSLIQGNGLIRLAPEASHTAGEEVEVLLLDRGLERGEEYFP